MAEKESRVSMTVISFVDDNYDSAVSLAEEYAKTHYSAKDGFGNIAVNVMMIHDELVAELLDKQKGE